MMADVAVLTVEKTVGDPRATVTYSCDCAPPLTSRVSPLEAPASERETTDVARLCVLFTYYAVTGGCPCWRAAIVKYGAGSLAAKYEADIVPIFAGIAADLFRAGQLRRPKAQIDSGMWEVN